MISLTSPVETQAHGWPAGAKIAALCLVSTALFFTGSTGVLLAALAVTLGLYAAPGREFLRAGLRGLRVLAPFVAVLLVWHWITGDMAAGLRVVLRMVVLVALANLVTMTTRLADLMDLVARLGAPLQRLGVPVHLLELAVGLVIRFTPVLVTRAGILAQGWRARSPRRPGWRLVLPMMVQALDDADHVAEALRARGSTLVPVRKE